jgi:hypothetical protein
MQTQRLESRKKKRFLANCRLKSWLLLRLRQWAQRLSPACLVLVQLVVPLLGELLPLVELRLLVEQLLPEPLPPELLPLLLR